MKPDQIALPLDWPQSAGDSRLILSDANRAAFEHFHRWSLWPVKATILTGPPRSGRTLLARSFVERVGGRLFDDAERRVEEEEALFHAWNDAQDSGRPLVIIADQAPPMWSVKLADLRTRLAVTPVISIGLPDDALFSALIQTYFADRGLHIPADALRFMADRLQRDYWTAERAVEAVDRLVLSERARLSLPTVRRALSEARMIGGEAA